MIKLYLILFSADLNREELTKFFDQNPAAINFWFYNMPSSIFVKSFWSAFQLQEFILNKFGRAVSVLVVELNSNTNYAGWLNKDHHKYFDSYLPKQVF